MAFLGGRPRPLLPGGRGRAARAVPRGRARSGAWDSLPMGSAARGLAAGALGRLGAQDGAACPPGARPAPREGGSSSGNGERPVGRGSRAAAACLPPAAAARPSRSPTSRSRPPSSVPGPGEGASGVGAGARAPTPAPDRPPPPALGIPGTNADPAALNQRKSSPSGPTGAQGRARKRTTAQRRENGARRRTSASRTSPRFFASLASRDPRKYAKAPPYRGPKPRTLRARPVRAFKSRRRSHTRRRLNKVPPERSRGSRSCVSCCVGPGAFRHPGR